MIVTMLMWLLGQRWDWFRSHVFFISWGQHWKGVYIHVFPRYCYRIGIDWHAKNPFSGPGKNIYTSGPRYRVMFDQPEAAHERGDEEKP